MKITRTILEEIIKDEYRALLNEKKFEQDGPGNPMKDEDGLFSSYEDSTSWSHKGKKKEMKSGKDVTPCGRGERRKCKSPQELKWEGLANKMMAILEEEFEETIDEKKRRRRRGKQPGPRCLTTAEVQALRNQVYQQLMQVVSDYEAAKKAKTAS